MTHRRENKLFNGDLFVFLIGPTHEKFHVHAQVVVLQSEVFDKMINGNFGEKMAGEAELHTEPETFANFLKYAYSYATRSPEQACLESGHNGKISMSKFVDCLLDHRQDFFKCKRCHNPYEIKHAQNFPLCDNCATSKTPLPWSSKCILNDCTQRAEYVQSLVCDKCLMILGLRHNSYAYNDEALRKLKYDEPAPFEEVEQFYFNIPHKALEMSALTEYSTPRYVLTSNDVLATVKLAIFADKNICRELFLDSLKELYRQLARTEPNDEDTKTLCEVVKFGYEFTCNETAGTQIPGHKTLRLMLSQFVACHCHQFLSSPAFKEIVSSGGDLAFDVIRGIAQLQSS